jgi:two-component system cell cycle sensor histidine kinase/response regulator CckA
MQSEFFSSMAQEVLVTSIDPDTGAAVPNPEWAGAIGPAAEPFRNLGDQADAARVMVERASRGRMSLGEVFMIDAEPIPRNLLLNFIPVHLAEKTDGLPVIITGEFMEFPSTVNSAQTLGHRMETLGHMTMGIAHDFNNLLSGIIGHAELMEGALNRDLDREVLSEHARTIHRAAQDGGTLIKKIQRYIRREHESAFVPVDLPALIQDCVVLTRPYWYNEPRSAGIAITVEQQLQVVPAILGSASSLRDVLVNLILNAVQAMRNGGVLTIKTALVDEQLVLTLQDTGIGMSTAVSERIFEPQFTTKKDGNGVGLSVASGIIQEHHGSIGVRSEFGVGTVFTLTFPVSESVQLRESAISSTASPLTGGIRVLVVDDESMVRTVLRRLLNLRGHEVTEADSGAAGLLCLESDTFDAIITDQGMPEMNGREFAARVRERRPDLPIILLTGDTYHGQADSVISAVLAKPFKVDEVEATMVELLSQSQA